MAPPSKRVFFLQRLAVNTLEREPLNGNLKSKKIIEEKCIVVYLNGSVSQKFFFSNKKTMLTKKIDFWGVQNSKQKFIANNRKFLDEKGTVHVHEIVKTNNLKKNYENRLKSFWDITFTAMVFFKKIYSEIIAHWTPLAKCLWMEPARCERLSFEI